MGCLLLVVGEDVVLWQLVVGEVVVGSLLGCLLLVVGEAVVWRLIVGQGGLSFTRRRQDTPNVSP